MNSQAEVVARETLVERKHKFQKELRGLINKYSIENGCDIPDFLLARFIMREIEALELTVRARDKWFSFQPFSNLEKIELDYKAQFFEDLKNKE